jgi:pimeloyl-ACP methyl ester carboxylesterase
MVVLSFTLVSLLAAIGTLAAPPNYPGPRHPEPHRPGRDQTFDPNTYVKQFAQCQAVDRSGAQPQNITLKLAYIDINPTAKKTLVMVHGWPSLWTTYRNQIAAFGSEYRLILPENRGFGSSEHPKDLYSSNAMFDVCFLAFLSTIPVAHGTRVSSSTTFNASWTMPVSPRASAWAMTLAPRCAGRLAC